MNEKEGQVGFKDDSRNKGFGDFEIAIKLSEKHKVCQKKQKNIKMCLNQAQTTSIKEGINQKNQKVHYKN